MQKFPTPYFGDLPEEKRHSQRLATFSGTGLRGRPAIYSLENEKTGKQYIGSTCNLAARILTHRRLLLSKEHCNYRLQSSFNSTPSREVWIVHVGLIPTRKEAREREQMILDEGFGHPDFLNISAHVDRPGDPAGFDKRIEKLKKTIRTEKHRKMVSDRSRAMWETPGYRENMISKIGEAVTVNGVRYNSVREASRESGFAIMTIRSRMVNNVATVPYSVKNIRKSVSCEGVIYPKVGDAAARYNVADNTMTYRLQSRSPVWKDFFYL